MTLPRIFSSLSISYVFAAFISLSPLNPSKNSIIIIVLKNTNGIIKSAHDGIPRHNNLHINVTNKSSLNTFLDRLNDGLFKNVIFIMTSNLPVANIMKLDVR